MSKGLDEQFTKETSYIKVIAPTEKNRREKIFLKTQQQIIYILNKY